MLITFEKLREVQLKEREGPLQKLPEDFFENAKSYLAEVSGSPEESNARKVLDDVVKRRLRKILDLALQCPNGARDFENMCVCEREIFSGVADLLSKWAVDFGTGGSGSHHGCDSWNAPVKSSISSPKAALREPRELDVNLSGVSDRSPDCDFSGVSGSASAGELESSPSPGVSGEESVVGVVFTTDTPVIVCSEAARIGIGDELEVPLTLAKFLESKGFCRFKNCS